MPQDFRLLTGVQWAPAGREALLTIATGKKGVGKSHDTLKLLNEYVMGDIAVGIKPRKGLIFDVNSEYGEFGIKTLFLEDIRKFNTHPICEIRRIIPWTTDHGTKRPRKMNHNEMIVTLQIILDTFAGGCLLVEDINKYAVRAMPDDVLGALCTNRHIDCDIILHYQSIARPLPMVWENSNMLRMHHQEDDVIRSKEKLKEKTEIFKIGQIIVDTEFFSGNERFSLWVNKDKGKIIGDFTPQKFEAAIMDYITSNKNILSPYLNRIDDQGNKVYTPAQAIVEMKKRKFQQYWGNNMAA